MPGAPLEELVTEFVTVGAGPAHFHVAYSARNGPNCEPDVTGNNVLVAVFELTDGRALVYGSGYGGRTHETECFAARYDAETDAALVDGLLRGCLDLGAAELVFVVPHGHVDHMNPEFVHALEAHGHVFDELWVHVGDEAAVRAIPAEPEAWEPDELARIHGFGSLAVRCETHPQDPTTVSFSSTLGPVFLSRREGHTDGAVDLILRHASGDYVLRGSAAPGVAGASNCDDPIRAGAIQRWNPHGNLVYQ